MQGGDPVGPLGEPQPHHRHVEEAGLAAGVGLHAQLKDAFDTHAGEFAVVAEVPGDQFAVEAVDPGGHRGVGGEDGAGLDGLHRGVEVESGAGEFPDAFEPEEACVPLVGVEHLGFRVSGEAAVGAHGAHPADAEEHLLEQPVLAAAAVQPVGHLAFARRVLLHVGVEHQQRYPADPGQPDVGVQRTAAGQGQHHPARGAVGLAHQGDRELVRVEHRVVLLLPAVARQALAEVAVPVEQADPDEGYAEVAGGLEVVATRMPSPPEYWGRAAVTPNSGEK